MHVYLPTYSLAPHPQWETGDRHGMMRALGPGACACSLLITASLVPRTLMVAERHLYN